MSVNEVPQQQTPLSLSDAAMARLGTWLKGEREARGWSPGHLALTCGLSRTAVRTLEDGRPDGTRPSATLDTLARLAMGLGYDLSYVLEQVTGTSTETNRLRQHVVLLRSIPEEDQMIVLAFLKTLYRMRKGPETKLPRKRAPRRFTSYVKSVNADSALEANNAVLRGIQKGRQPHGQRPRKNSDKLAARAVYVRADRGLALINSLPSVDTWRRRYSLQGGLDDGAQATASA